MASIITIEYDGTDITGHCVYEECSFEAQMAAVPGTFTVTLKDLNQELEFITGKELTLDIDGTRLYGGFVTQVTKTYFFPADDTTVLANVRSRKWVLNGVDYNILLDKLVFHNAANYTQQVPDTASADSDAAVIRNKFGDYFDIPSGFDFSNASYIIPNHTYSGSFHWTTQGATMRQVLDLWGLYGAVFWIDANKQFNFLPVQDTAAAYGFSDKPSAGFYGFREGEFIEDATAIINDALVWGGSEWASDGDVVFARRENATSIANHGRWQVGEVRVGEANYKIQSEVTGRAKTIVDGNESGTFAEGSQGMVNPEKQFRCTWFSVDVPSHIRPGHVVPIELWVFSEDSGATPFSVSLPLRQLTITFPIINPDGEAFVQFEGFFGVLMSDPKWLWAFLRQSTNQPARVQTISSASNSSVTPPAGSIYQGEPSPATDGSTTAFTIPFAYQAGSTLFFVNGLLQDTTAYSESNPAAGEFTLTFAPDANDELFVKAVLVSGGLVSGGPSGGGGGAGGGGTGGSLGPLYGSAWAMDSKSNLAIGGSTNEKVSYRFQAIHTGNAIRAAINVRGAPPGHGYSAGDGGQIKMALQADSSGDPSGTDLSSVTWTPGNPSVDWEDHGYHSFASPVPIVSGQYYHLVFSNPAADPVNNWVSVNFCWMEDPDSPREPAFDDTNMVMWERGAGWKKPGDSGTDLINSNWLFDLVYSDATHTGQGYLAVIAGAGERWVQGSSEVRERFTPSANISVTSAAVRLKRISGTGNLVLSLKTGTGTLIESVSITSTGIPTSPDYPASGYLWGGRWVTATFASTHDLLAGTAYQLVVSTDSGTRFMVMPVRPEDTVGWTAPVFTDGRGEFSTDGGSSWGDLYTYAKSDLQFYFTKA